MYGSCRETEDKAKMKYEGFPFLTFAECVMVIMYRDEMERKFYKECNEASRDGKLKRCKVYTPLF